MEQTQYGDNNSNAVGAAYAGDMNLVQSIVDKNTVVRLSKEES
jgi:hypothetical protein